MAAVQKYVKATDMLLLFLALLICGIGLVLIYSTTRYYNTNRYIYVQAAAIGLGIVGYIVVSLLNLRRFPRLWIFLFFFNIAFQLSLQFLGTDSGTGNKSWIAIGGTGLNIQPGEVGKIIFIYTLACHIQELEDRLNTFPAIAALTIHMGVTMLAVFIISRDLGVALMYPLIFIIVLFAARVKFRWFLLYLLLILIMLPAMWNLMNGYQKDRILVVFDPEISEERAWHARQSVNALARGGVTGVGYLKGRHFVNRHSDFIFAACGEEFGLIGAGMLTILLSALVLRIFYDGTKADDLFGYVLCFGIGGMLLVQIFLNIGMCVQIMPVIGITLPLVSYGGTSVATTLASVGIVAGVLRSRKPSWLKQGQK